MPQIEWQWAKLLCLQRHEIRGCWACPSHLASARRRGWPLPRQLLPRRLSAEAECLCSCPRPAPLALGLELGSAVSDP